MVVIFNKDVFASIDNSFRRKPIDSSEDSSRNKIPSNDFNNRLESVAQWSKNRKIVWWYFK